MVIHPLRPATSVDWCTAVRGASVLALFALPVALGAQARELPRTLAPRPTVPAITEGDLMTRLYQFADDSMGGRASGTPGHAMATAYLAAEMRRLGLRPAGTNGSYYQDLPMVRRGFEPGGQVRAGTRAFAMGTDFLPVVARGGSPREVGQAEVVLGGTAGDSTTWISAEAAAGKVVVLTANPRQATLNLRTFAIGPTSRFASAAAVVMPGLDRFPAGARANALRASIGLAGPGSSARVPLSILATDAMHEALVAAAGRAVTVDVAYREASAPTRNVIAMLPGSDPRLRGQYVALGAHNDHDPLTAVALDHDSLRAAFAARAKVAPRVIVPGSRASRPDSIKNGADDDGSGSVALLEIAEAFATSSARPKRSILFVWHAAEELGLLGAEHFVANPTVPLDSIVAQLNMDMVGRGGATDIEGGGPQYLQLVGSRRLSRELGDLVESVNARQPRPFRFDYAFDADGHPERIYCRSDHAAYAKHGIPVTFFHTGLHLDYHQVTDEPQYIDYDKLHATTRLIHDVAMELANRPARPKLDGPRPDSRVACRQ
jgi:hypothetical protein